MQKIKDYQDRLNSALADLPKHEIVLLAEALLAAWNAGKQVFFCGNGGSAANAIHIANDLFYGVAAKGSKTGIRVQALSANQAVLTCLANDISYADIFSEQLKVFAQPGDVLVVLSGSGNSQNIVRALESAKELGVKSFAVLGYSGGLSKELTDTSIHIAVNDMQIAEDLQLVVGHMVMQWLRSAPGVPA